MPRQTYQDTKIPLDTGIEFNLENKDKFKPEIILNIEFVTSMVVMAGVLLLDNLGRVPTPTDCKIKTLAPLQAVEISQHCFEGVT